MLAEAVIVEGSKSAYRRDYTLTVQVCAAYLRECEHKPAHCSYPFHSTEHPNIFARSSTGVVIPLKVRLHKSAAIECKNAIEPLRFASKTSIGPSFTHM